MKNRVSLRDRQLTFRMLFTIFMLGLVYLAFVGLLLWAGIPFIAIIIMALIMVVSQYFMSDRIVLWSTGAKEVSPQQESKLHGIIDRLVQTAGMHKPKVAIMETHVPNAFATGRNPKKAVVAVTRGLMTRLDDRELEAVLAHELTHVKNRDVMVITWASLIVIAAAFLMRILFLSSLFGGGFGGGGGRRGGGGQAMLIMMAVMVGTIVIYVIAQILIMALSRYREYSADRGSAILTGSPSQLASALSKISGTIARIPQKDLRNISGANAFFIVSALNGKGIANLFSNHPPVEKRIERLQMLQRQMEGF